MLNGLSLFTGYGGIDLALAGHVRPLLYCEIEDYAQAILLSRMDDGSLPVAPVWNDVTSLDGKKFKGLVDIISGGFPCQDISVAGNGAGLDGKRSGLFKEIVRLAKEIRPAFVFLENVPAIEARGAEKVQEALAGIGFSTRWTHLSASEIGANHKRERWFCLAFNSHNWKQGQIQGVPGGPSSEPGGVCSPVPHSASGHDRIDLSGASEGQVQQPGVGHLPRNVSNADGNGREARSPLGVETSDPATTEQVPELDDPERERLEGTEHWRATYATGSSWWAAEPRVGRVVNGTPFRPHRVKALGNGVVPLQVRTAFEKLAGIAR